MNRKILIAILLAGLAWPAAAAAPLRVSFQGKLEDGGQPVTGTRNFVFKIYDALTGGTLLWTSQTEAVAVTNGVFSVVLQTGTPANLSTATFSGARYVEITVDGTLLSPREEVVSAPYSLVAQSLASGAMVPLNALEKDPSGTSLINTSTNPVDWSQLKNVPAGFADGADDSAGALTVQEGGATVLTPATTLDFNAAQFNASPSAPTVTFTLDSASVTLQGNAFNGALQLVRLDGTGKLPVLDGSALTGISASAVAAANVTAGTLGTAVVASSVPAANVGVGWLGAQVVASSLAVNSVYTGAIVSIASSKLTGALPALDGSALTGVSASAVAAANVTAGNLGTGVVASSVPAANVGVGKLGPQVVASSIAVNGVYTGAIADSAVTDAKIAGIAASKIAAGNLGTAVVASSVPAANVGVGWLGAQVVASSLAVNSVYNGAVVSMASSKLTGALPALDGSALTGVTAAGVAAANVAAGNLGAAVVASSVPAANVGVGKLGPQVVASSIAVNGVYTAAIADSAVTDAKIAGVAASKIAAGTAGISVSGSAATLTTSRNINGTAFNGSADITVPVNSADDTTASAEVYPLWTTAAGNNAAKISTTKFSMIPADGTLSLAGGITASSATTTGDAEARGGLKVGVGGTKITRHLSATFALNAGSITTPPECLDLSANTLTGAALGDTVTVSANTALPSNFILQAFVSAADTVDIRWCQLAGAGADPDDVGGATYRVDVWKH